MLRRLSQLSLLLSCAASVACSGDKSSDSGADGGSCTPSSEPGTATAEVDGTTVEWTDVAWTETGAGLQITTGTTDELRLTLVANDVAETVLGGASVLVSLDGTGGFGLLYAGADSHSSQDGTGTMTVLPPAGGALRACFSFTSDGPVVSSGELSAAELVR